MIISFTMTNAQATRLTNALCANFGYQAMIYDAITGTDIPNPETKAEFAKRCLVNYMKTTVHEYERRKIAEEAIPDPMDVT